MIHNSSISDCTDIKQTVDNSDIGDPNESKTETIDDNMQDQTNNIDNKDQNYSEFESTDIIQTDNNTLDFNSPIDFNDHNSSMVTQAEINNNHKESKPTESEYESDSKSFESESIDFDLTVMLPQSMTLKILRPWDSNINKKLELLILAQTCKHKSQNVQTYMQYRSNNLSCLNCKSFDHLVKDCPEPNKMQQPQNNNRQNRSIESAIEAPTQTLKSLLSNQKSHGYSKPKQPFHHKKAKSSC